jgi:hypothetical protein
MRAGFETPTFSEKIIQNYDTSTMAPSNVNFRYTPIDSKDGKLWQDVEYNRYISKLMDTSHFGNTQAYFTTNDGGMTNIVHAPSGSGLQIISPAKTTISGISSYIETENEGDLLQENIFRNFLA